MLHYPPSLIFIQCLVPLAHLHLSAPAHLHCVTLTLSTSRIHTIPGVIVKELSVAVDTGDDSYMPKELAVLVGNSEAGLRELKTVMVPRWAMCATRVCSMVHQYSCVDHLFVYIIMYSVLSYLQWEVGWVVSSQGQCAVLMGLARVLQLGCALWLVGRVDT